MRDVLLAAMPVLLWVMAGLDLLFFVLLLAQFARNPQKKLPLWIALIAFGLFYDALILALGTVMPEGGLLKILSLFRFILHCALIPLIFPVCGIALGLKKKGMTVVWVVTCLLIAVGIAAGTMTVLTPQTVHTVVRYTSDKALTPGWAEGIQSALSYGPVVVMMICGLIAWIRRKNPHLFLAGLFMFVFAALGPATGNFDLIFFISMFGEVLMTVFCWLFARKQGKTAENGETQI